MTVRTVLHETGEIVKAIVLLPPLAVVTVLIVAGVLVAKLCGVDFEQDTAP